MFINKNEGWFFVLPLIIWLSLSILFPLYIAVDLSFYNVKIIGTEGQFYGIKNFLMLEPTISLVVTFAGLWLLWSGISWMKYIIMISGILMHLSIIAVLLLLLKDLTFHKSYFSKQ